MVMRPFAPRAPRAHLALVPHSAPQSEREVVADAELVERALAGEASAYAGIYRKHVDYLAGMSARLLRSRIASEDVVQDTFVLAFERLSSLRDPTALRSWLAAIAVSFVRRRLRRRRLLRFLGLDRSGDEVGLEGLAREDLSAEARSELAAIDVALGELSTEERIAWMLRHVDGDSLDDVAHACGCSLATAKRRIARADAHVRAVLEGGTVA
jgi:RNA polymerase sigma-70 factor (ECF subfamily)